MASQIKPAGTAGFVLSGSVKDSEAAPVRESFPADLRGCGRLTGSVRDLGLDE